ncbi:transferase [Mangrovactinospora gilvigrisea]|uniref:Transferase n=1 Tax=Mangrovactinospora gilvigrisea TaxID=1428644 RepID=A0A1J7C849_9ACTN|nr:DUF5941 domain-containing protein [Mangrovactinospora gilvigrisea]OIV35818.1 transferase [Mangrovactinospora gilvigrisea]
MPPGSGRSELAAALADVPPGERVAVIDARFTGHPHALRLALIDPRFDAVHVPGVLTVDGPARAALDAAVRAAPGGLADPDVLAAELASAGVAPVEPELGELVAAVPRNGAEQAAAEAAIAAVDDEAVRLRRAVKSRDGFFTTFCVSPYSRYIARWCARRGLTPNQVTTASLAVAVIAALCAATGTRIGFVAAGVLLLASFVLDCTDGQLARYALKYSKLGAWLDATFDRAKEYVFYAGLAVGAISAGGDRVWALALGAMILQTCRHVVDFSYNEAYADSATNDSPTAGISDRLDAAGWTVWARRIVVLPIGERWALIAVLTACTTPRITLVVLLIACGLAACYTTAGRLLRSVARRRARRSEAAARAVRELADNGPIADAVARVLRGALADAPVLAAPLIALFAVAVQLGALLFGGAGHWWSLAPAVLYALCAGAATARPLRGPLDWLVPPFFRAGEYLTVLLLAALAVPSGASGSDRVLPAAFGLVAAVAYHHYDTVYRIRGGAGAPSAALRRGVGGQEGRVVLLTVLAAAVRPAGSLELAFTLVAAVVAAVVVTESIRFWISAEAPAVHDEAGEAA